MVELLLTTCCRSVVRRRPVRGVVFFGRVIYFELEEKCGRGRSHADVSAVIPFCQKPTGGALMAVGSRAATKRDVVQLLSRSIGVAPSRATERPISGGDSR